MAKANEPKPTEPKPSTVAPDAKALATPKLHDSTGTPLVTLAARSQNSGPLAMYLDTAMFDQAWRAARLMASTKMVPVHFQGHPEDCFVAIELAQRLDVDPFMLMQNTYVVGQKPGMEAKLVIALVNSRGPFRGPIQWDFNGSGKDKSCTAYAVHKATNQRCEATVDWRMVEAEGWSKKAGSKWLTMPDQMFMYRSAAFLARLYCPEVLMGMQTVDELRDIIDVTPETIEPGSRTDSLANRLTAKPAPAEAIDNETGEITTPEDAPASDDGDGSGEPSDAEKAAIRAKEAAEAKK